MGSKGLSLIAFRRLCLIVTVLTCFAIGPAQAENFSSDLRGRARELSEVYRARAVEILTTYLEARRFYVDVEVVPRVSGVVDLPYVPKNKLNLGSNPSLMDDVQNLISSVRVNLKLPADLTQQSQKQLQDILFKDLPLDRWRGDSVQLRTMHFAEPASRTMESRSTNLASPPSIDVQSGPSQKPASDQTGTILADKLWNSVESWMIPGLIMTILAAIFSVLVMVGMLRMLRSLSSMNIRDQNQIKQQDQRSEPAVSPSSKRSDPKLSQRIKTRNLRQVPIQTAGAINSQLQSFRTKIASMFASNPIALSCAAELAARYLDTDQETNKILAMLDLIPDTTGQEVYSRLSTLQRQKIQMAAQQFVSDHQLGLLALEVGEELVSLIRSRSLSQSESEYSHQIREFLSRTNDDELAKLLPAINVDVLPRMLFYFDSRRLARILTLVRTADGSFNNRLSWALLSMPAIENKTALDQPIVNLLNAMQELVKRREAMRYFPQIKSLIDELPEQMRRDMRDNLMHLNDDFAKFMAGYHPVTSQEERQNHSDTGKKPHPEWKSVA